MEVSNDDSFSMPQENDGSRLDSGMLIDCDDECPFCLFKGDFLCDKSASAFRDDCHSSGMSFLADFSSDLALSGLSFSKSCSAELNVQSEF